MFRPPSALRAESRFFAMNAEPDTSPKAPAESASSETTETSAVPTPEKAPEVAPIVTEAAEVAAPDAPAPTAEAATETAPGGALEGAVTDEDAAEGDDSASEEEASAESAGGDAPKKKRRRRRRKKAAAAPGEGGESPEAAEGSSEEGAEEGQKAGEAPAKKAGKKKKGAAKPKEGQPGYERPAFHIGEEVFGKVTSVTDEAIMVDLSGKALGIFDRRELAEDDLLPAVDDRFVARIHGDGGRGGLVVLTRKPLREEEAKPKVEEALKNQTTVEGLVTGVVKGGVEVDVEGLRAFGPASHMDLRLGADLAHLIGQRLEFHVAQFGKRGRDVVLSRKQFLETEAREARQSSLAKVEIGAIVKGIVRTVVAYGVFVALPSADDVEGLVHMTEASHDRGTRLNELFKPGQEIEVKVLKVDEKGKLWLSHKAAIPDPWAEVKAKYAVGSRHTGKVVRLQPFGVFVELEPGIDGLVHTADLSFKPIEHPQDVVNVGDEIEVVVASLDDGGRKIKLHPAPPQEEADEPRQRIAPHKSVRVAVVSAEAAGLIVRILGATGRQARGFIPAGHTGTPRGTDLRKQFPTGMKLDVKVLDIDPRRGEPKLSIRALKEDSEKAAYNEYRASVAKASKFGTLGDLLAKKNLS